MVRKRKPPKVYRNRVWLLREERGDKCECTEERCHGEQQPCGSKIKLEFAHIKPTPLTGRGRGSTRRYYDIKRNPDAYRLLCWSPCHLNRDLRQAKNDSQGHVDVTDREREQEAYWDGREQGDYYDGQSV